jgi:Rab-GTPase-TBC domain
MDHNFKKKLGKILKDSIMQQASSSSSSSSTESGTLSFFKMLSESMSNLAQRTTSPRRASPHRNEHDNNDNAHRSEEPKPTSPSSSGFESSRRNRRRRIKLSKVCVECELERWQTASLEQRRGELGDTLRQYMRVKGTSHAMRAWAWPLLCDSEALRVKNEGVYGALSKDALGGELARMEIKIQKDLARTLPLDDRFRVGGSLYEPLRRVLRAYALFNSTVGYVQGQNFIVAALLLYVAEDVAFWMFASLMRIYLLQSNFAPGLPGIEQRCAKLGELVGRHLPDVHRHMEHIGLSTHHFAMKWMLALFQGCSMDLDVSLRILECFFVEGWHLMFSVALNIVHARSDALLAARDFDDAFMVLSTAPASLSVDQLLATQFDEK